MDCVFEVISLELQAQMKFTGVALVAGGKPCTFALFFIKVSFYQELSIKSLDLN